MPPRAVHRAPPAAVARARRQSRRGAIVKRAPRAQAGACRALGTAGGVDRCPSMAKPSSRPRRKGVDLRSRTPAYSVEPALRASWQGAAPSRLSCAAEASVAPRTPAVPSRRDRAGRAPRITSGGVGRVLKRREIACMAAGPDRRARRRRTRRDRGTALSLSSTVGRWPQPHPRCDAIHRVMTLRLARDPVLAHALTGGRAWCVIGSLRDNVAEPARARADRPPDFFRPESVYLCRAGRVSPGSHTF